MCPDDSLLHDLVDDELTPEQRQELLAHVSGCADCRKIVRELIILAACFQARPARGDCPESRLLQEFAQGRLSDPLERGRIRSHVESCLACARLVRILAGVGGSEDEPLTPRQRAREIVEACVRVLLPGSATLVDLIWERVLELVESLKTPEQEIAGLPRITEQLVGAMGFRGSPDPSVISAHVIASTVVLTTDEWSLGQIKSAGVKDFARRTAQRLGAGAELSARLSELLETHLSKG